MADQVPDWAAAPVASGVPDWAGGAPARQFSGLQSAATGAADTATFGLAPALEGVATASGQPAPTDVASRASAAAARRPLEGAWNLIHENVLKPILGQQADPEVNAAYNRGRQAALEDERLAQEQHPGAYLAGQVSGALTAPGFGVARGVTAAERIGYGARAGAIAGGLYGAGEGVSQGESAPQIALGSGRGALTGAAFGAAGSGLVEAASPLAEKASAMLRAARDPEAEGSRQLVGAMAEDWKNAGQSWQPLTPEQTAAANAAGTPRAIVDVMGPQTRALAEWSAMNSPEAQNALRTMTDDRLHEQAPRIAGFIQQMTGGGDLAADVEAVQAAGRRANRPAYQRAYNDPAGHALWDGDFEQIMQSPDVQQAAKDAVRTGANKAAAQGYQPIRNPFQWDQNGAYSLATGPQGQRALPNLQFWDAVKQNLDDKIGAALRAGEKGQAGDLLDLKRQLVTKLDQAVPAYATARQGAASFFGAENALEAGSKFVSAGSNMNLGKARAALAKMSPAEQDLFARGFATELSTRIMKSGDSRGALNSAFLNNPVAQTRIKMALGPQNARDLEALLRAEEVVNSTRSLYLGSPTARRLAMQGTMGVGFAGAEGYLDPTHDWSHAMLAGLAPFAAGRANQILNQRVAAQLGTMLTSDNPAVLAKGVRLMSRNPALFNALRQATGGVARGATAAVQPLGNSPQNSQLRPPGFAKGGRVNPANINHNPSESQKEAGNYAKDHVNVHGMNITIENAKGSNRTGVDKGGKPWSVKMPAHYGYIKGTVGKDKDHVDVYLGPNKVSPKVFVVDQINADSGKFDEHKAFVGFGSKMQAINTYHAAFSDGRGSDRFGHITQMTVDEFKRWLHSGDTTKPLRYGRSAAA